MTTPDSHESHAASPDLAFAELLIQASQFMTAPDVARLRWTRFNSRLATCRAHRSARVAESKAALAAHERQARVVSGDDRKGQLGAGKCDV